MKLDLAYDSVILVAIDFTDNNEEILYAYEQTIKQVNFENYYLFLRNKEDGHYIAAWKQFKRKYPFVNIILIDEDELFKGIEEYSRFILAECYSHLDTNFKHAMFIQWDGFVLNTNNWKKEFLDYDYVGAPWYFPQFYGQVGNGGFSIRSKNLMEDIYHYLDLYYYNTMKWSLMYDKYYGKLDFCRAEDNIICIANKDFIESRNMKIAPESIAKNFSCETIPYDGTTFGFHGVFYPNQLPDIVKYRVKRY